MVILTNGNTGALIQEVLKSISTTYDWNAHHQRTIDIVEVSSDKLEEFTGRYLWTDRPSSNWTTEVVLRDGKLHIIASGFPTNRLTPYGNNKFIDLEADVHVNFKASNGNKIDGLTWRGRFNFRKTD